MRDALANRGNAQLQEALELSEQRHKQLELAHRELTSCQAAAASHEQAAARACHDSCAVRSELAASERATEHERGRAEAAEQQLSRVQCQAHAAEAALHGARQEVLALRVRAEAAERQLACLETSDDEGIHTE